VFSNGLSEKDSFLTHLPKTKSINIFDEDYEMAYMVNNDSSPTVLL
jgi:hypothetical protein